MPATRAGELHPSFFGGILVGLRQKPIKEGASYCGIDGGLKWLRRLASVGLGFILRFIPCAETLRPGWLPR